MTRERTLAWLAAWQAELSTAVRTPLRAHGGMLRTDPSRYASRACAGVVARPQRTAAKGLAVYNRQYWLRLLRATQEALPLTCRLLGAWHFNALATPFLLAHPPRGRDLSAVAEGFDRFVERALREDVQLGPARVVPREAVLESARIDAAFRRSFVAPEEPIFQPDASLQPDARLALSQALTVVREGWALLALRDEALAAGAEKPLALPERLAPSQTWAVFRSPRGTGRLLLDPQHARLLELLGSEPLAGALAQLEAESPATELDGLPAKVRAWLSKSVRLGFFTGVRSLG